EPLVGERSSASRHDGELRRSARRNRLAGGLSHDSWGSGAVIADRQDSRTASRGESIAARDHHFELSIIIRGRSSRRGVGGNAGHGDRSAVFDPLVSYWRRPTGAGSRNAERRGLTDISRCVGGLGCDDWSHGGGSLSAERPSG